MPDPGGAWYAMPLAMRDLGHQLATGQIPWQALRAGLLGVADVVTRAHALELVHRDLHDANILVYPDRWCVGDWGFVYNPRVDRLTRQLTAFGRDFYIARRSCVRGYPLPSTSARSVGVMSLPERMPRGGVDYPRSFPELVTWFPDEAACLEYLERVRWGDGFVCRFCGVQGDWWPVRRGHRKCAACRRETSVTAGTIMHASRLPLTSWLAAIWYVVNQKQGVSALGLQRVLGFGSYQTAWAWLHKLRRAMVRANRDRLSGIVEIDETIIGGLRHGEGKGRGMANKTLVAIAVDTRDGRPGRVRMAQIPNATMDVLTDFVLDNVQIGSEVRTDGWKGYNAVGRHRFQHVLTSLKASDDHAHVACQPSIASRRCSSAGCWAPTKAPSATSTSATTSTSSPFASTAAQRAIVACSSTA